MKADTILVLGIATVIIGMIMFIFDKTFIFLPIPLAGLVIMCIAIIKQNDEHTKW